jgi:hypothetical protein
MDRKELFRNAAGHFRTITRHKLTVMDLCFKVGLVKQGLLHDLSKYSPVEFKTGILYYQGDRSPNAKEKREKGYSDAWLHHKGRNRHHFEYWMDLSYNEGEQVYGAKMPLRYVLEMVCDRVAACKVYHGENYRDRDALDYFNLRRDVVESVLHPETAELMVRLLTMLAERGEKKTLAYMRWLLRHPQIYEAEKEGSNPFKDPKRQ